MIFSANFYLYELFSQSTKLGDPLTQMSLDEMIVLLRLEAKASLSSISEIVKLHNYSKSSVGLISERLKKFGGKLPSTLKLNKPREVFYLSDEIYASGKPILVTIDPVSTAILKIELGQNCTASTWKNHFQDIEDNGFITKGLASDRGIGIVKGYEAMHSAEVWCSDHFHEFRGLTRLLKTMETRAYQSIENEEERLQVFNNARSESNMKNRLAQYESEKLICEQRINEYQHVQSVLNMLFPELYFFNIKTGSYHTSASVKEDILILMDLLDELKFDKLQDETKSIRDHIDDICVCYQQVDDICQTLSKTMTLEEIQLIGIAWQHKHQSYQRKGKLKKYHENESDVWLEIISPLLGNDAEELIAKAFDEFNSMVRTSSLIEMVNSQIRPFINECKGQITQEHLNLIMFYHNHRLYKSGKRKGKAPIEILTKVKLQKNWLDLLSETIAQP